MLIIKLLYGSLNHHSLILNSNFMFMYSIILENKEDNLNLRYINIIQHKFVLRSRRNALQLERNSYHKPLSGVSAHVQNWRGSRTIQGEVHTHRIPRPLQLGQVLHWQCILLDQWNDQHMDTLIARFLFFVRCGICAVRNMSSRWPTSTAALYLCMLGMF